MSQLEDYFESSPESSSQFDLSWALGFVSRYRWWIIGVTALALIPAVMIPLTLSDTYQATARVMVQARPQAMDLGSDYMPNDGLSRQTNPLARVREVALSDAVLGRVVDQLPVETPSDAPPGLLGRARQFVLSLGSSFRTLTPAQMRKARIDGVSSQVSIEADGSSAMLYVSAVGSVPNASTFLANAVADAIVDYNKDEQRDSYERTVTWLNTQVLELRERVNSNQDALNQHESKYGILPESKAAEQSSERASLMRELKQTEIELQTVRGRLRELPPQLSNPYGESYDPAVQRLQARYDASVTALEEARLTYTPTHPEVKRREQVVKQLQAELLAQGPVGPVGGVSQADQQEFRSLMTQENGLRARRSVLQRTLDEMSDPDAKKSRAMGEYERLQRQLSLDRELLDMLMHKREEVVLLAAADYTMARVLDRAIPPVLPIGPNRPRFMLIGVVLALAAGIGVSLARELLDQTVRDPDQAGRLLGGIPVIGMVPMMRDGTPPERQSEGSPSTLSAESYRNLRTALLFSSVSQGFTTVVVTSGQAGEGKTTISANLSSSFAQSGRSVLLIDADMRVPRVHRVFSISPAPGLAELLRGEVSLETAVRRPSEGRFDILPSGKQPPNPSELLASPEFAMLLARVRTQYDLVVIDSPVLLGVSDTQLLASQADATLLVYRPGTLAKRGLREMHVRLEQARARVLGLVFNQVPRRDRHFYPSYMESPYLREDGRREAVEA